jgi:hypothetical protein
MQIMHTSSLADYMVIGFVISVFVIFALALIYGDFQSGRRINDR